MQYFLTLNVKLTLNDSGLAFLERADVLTDFWAFYATEQSETEESLTDYLLQCAATRFWGAAALHRGQDVVRLQSNYPILKPLESHLTTHQPELLFHSLTLLGNFGGNYEGLKVLVENGAAVLDTFANLYQRASGDLKIKAMQTLSCLLTLG